MLCAINYRDTEYYGLYLQPQTFKSLKLEKKLKKKTHFVRKFDLNRHETICGLYLFHLV